MGRCYEFGAAITDGCDHPMVVADEGGYCHCAACRANCGGRFSACPEVVSMPGYVPLAAPAPAPRPAPTTVAVAGPLAPAVPGMFGTEPPAPRAAAQELPDLDYVRSVFESLLDRPDRAAQAIEVMEQSMAARDVELLAAFERLTTAYQELTDEVRADHAARERLVEAVEQLSQRLEAAEARRPLLRANPFRT